VSPAPDDLHQARRRAQIVGVSLVLAVVMMALSEAIAIYGLVLFLLGGQPLGFAAVALVVLASQFPRLSRWGEDQAREARRARA